MSRVKTFDATGISPGGVLFAGDLNSIQDHYADLSNFSQTVDVGTLRVGDTSLSLIKYGTGEFRLTGALRTDGILRALGGSMPGQFTTAGRPGAGSRPYGLIIWNTDTSRLEINVGSDASPTWLSLLTSVDVIQMPLGAAIDYSGSVDVSSSLILADGRELNRTTFASYFALVSTTYGAGNGTTTFNIPDCRGRVTVAPDNMGTARGDAARLTANDALGNGSGEEKHTMSLAEMVAHNHGGLTGSGTSGNPSVLTGGTTDVEAAHTHGMSQQIGGKQGGSGLTDNMVFMVGASGTYNTGVSMSGGGSHSHAITINNHTHSVPQLSIPSAGSTTPFNVMQPYTVLNKLVRVA